MSLYQRGKGKKKSWYYNFQYNGQRYNDCIGPVSKTRAKEIYARKRAEVAEGGIYPRQRNRVRSSLSLWMSISSIIGRIVAGKLLDAM